MKIKDNMQKVKNEIEINNDRSKTMIKKIQIYIKEEFGESIGELRAGFLLEFFMKELGPSIYNQGINDAQAFIQDKLIDLESALSLEETRYSHNTK